MVNYKDHTRKFLSIFFRVTSSHSFSPLFGISFLLFTQLGGGGWGSDGGGLALQPQPPLIPAKQK
jgi:hypothetical protein